MEAMNCDKSDDAVQQSENTTQKLDNTIKQSDSTIEQSDSIVEQSDSTIEQSEGTIIDQAEDTVEQSESIMEQSESILEQSENTMEQSESTMEQSESTMEQLENTMEQPESTVGQSENMVEQSENTMESTTQQSDNAVKQSDNTMEHVDDVVDQTAELQDSTKQNPEIIGTDKDKPVPMEVECYEQANDESIDFTADISLDQLDTQKEVTDEDVMHHLDVIENIDLDPETFCINKSIENDESENFKSDEEDLMQDDEVTIIEEVMGEVEEEWYKEKIAAKEELVKDKLSKLARVLGISYPHYEKWLERIEKKDGSPICKMDPFRRCPLNKPHTNRWKFLCVRKDMQITVKEEDKPGSYNTSSTEVWSLEPTSTWGVDVNNKSEFPPFVLKAVKIFEDFLQTTVTPETSSSEEYLSCVKVPKQKWTFLLVRSNSKDELMLFATGKYIDRDTMDRLKEIYESGPGKDCNVKSLYCKTVNKSANNKINANTTFLVGAEALDEVVGDLKVQLSPKTNFWSNAAGALNVAKAVMDMLRPLKKVTILEIGCGLGVVGLMMAPKCLEVIGIDSPSEVEEAEITCELNNITNASFIMGSPVDVVNQINATVKNRATYAVINANTQMGRAVEVMTCLRKLTSLRRIVMVTTLSKQSVRAVLELTRPRSFENGFGHPFMPIRACVVDTLPIGPHFETVILMEPRLMHRLTQSWFLKILEEENKSLENTRALEKVINNKGYDSADMHLRKSSSASDGLAKKSKSTTSASPAKITSPAKKTASSSKSGSKSPMKKQFRQKRETESPEIIEIPKKMTKKYDNKHVYKKQWNQPDYTAKKKNWFYDKSNLRINPLFDKKGRDKDQVDLRAKLSSNRIDADLVQKVNESRDILEAAKVQLGGPSHTVDATTAKELQNVLSLVLEQTNKIQNQLPRSVWDRIAPPENAQDTSQAKTELDEDPLLKGRFVHETNAQDILITTANKEYMETGEVKPTLPYKKYHNLQPLEPDAVLPISLRSDSDEQPKVFQRSFDNRGRQQNQGNSWNKNKNFFQRKTRWSDAGPTRKPVSPVRKQNSPFRHRMSSPRRPSPKRLMSPPRRPCSPPKRHLSSDRPASPSSYQGRSNNSLIHREYSPQRRNTMSASSGGRRDMSLPRRSFSPSNRAMSPPKRRVSPPPRRLMAMSPMDRPLSPEEEESSLWERRSSMSPPRLQMSPMRMYDSSSRQMSPMRRPSPIRHRPMSPMRRQMSPERRPMSPPGRMMSPSRSRGIVPQRHQSPVRRPSPHRMPPGHEFSSPPRRQQSPPRRQSPPQNRFGDEWDIPNRGAIEQGTWQRPTNERPAENVWRNERQPTTGGNWQPLADNDKYRKSQNQQDRSWDTRDSASHGNSWGNSKQLLAKPNMKESWNQNSENKTRWSGPSRSGNNDNWNIRGQENMGGRKETWMDADNRQRWEQQRSNDSWNQEDKDDWNDLPEDARDPWGDDGNELEERWVNVDNQVVAPSNWSRETDKGNPWSKPKDNWQNKSQAFSAKPSCQSSGNPNMNESRWLAPNEANKKAPSTSWQGGGNTGTWQQSSNYNFQSQRPFNTNVFKDRR